MSRKIIPHNPEGTLRRKEVGDGELGGTTFSGHSGELIWAAQEDNDGYVETRSGSFANDGVPKVKERDSFGVTAHDNLYLWKPGNAYNGGRESPSSSGFRGLVWDGDTLFGQVEQDGYVYKFDNDLNQTGGFAYPGSKPRDISYGGSSYWSTDVGPDKIYQMDANGTVQSSFNHVGTQPWGIQKMNDALFVGGLNTGTIYRMDTNGTVLREISTPLAEVRGIQFDGRHFWVNSDGAIHEFDRGWNKLGELNAPHSVHTGAVESIAWDGEELISSGVNTSYIYKMSGLQNYVGGAIR